MTRGGLALPLLLFSIPLVLSGLLQQLFNWADALIVGNVEGELALAAVSVAATIPAVLVLVITGLTSGLGILCAQLFGRQECGALEKVLSSFVILVGGLCLAVGFAGSIFADEILRVIDTSADMFVTAEEYLRICLLGTGFVGIYNVYAAVLRGCGDSKAAFFSICVASVVNVGLDLLFVAMLGWGAAGAAWATVISQGMMTGFIILYTGKKYPWLRVRLSRNGMDRQAVRHGLGLGLPLATQYSIKSVGNMVLQRFMNGFDSQTVAAITTAYRIDTVLMLPVMNLATGIATAVAQNTGVGNVARAKRSFYIGTAVVTITCVLLTIFVLVFGRGMLALFGISTGAVEIGMDFFKSIARFYLLFGFCMVARSYLEGCGDVKFASAASVLMLLVRIAMSLWVGQRMGSEIFAIAESVSWGVLLALCAARYLWLDRQKGRGTTLGMERD